jgi:phosphoenolpyruvate-protein phosphotransferase (PTS system enzyme I)
MFSLHGAAIGGGIVIGRAQVLEPNQADVRRYRVSVDQLEQEVARFDAALTTVKGELTALASQLPKAAPTEARALLEVHAMMLSDPTLVDDARRMIHDQGWNAEWSIASQANKLSEQFEAFEDEYLRERGRDVQQVADRVLRVLSGSQQQQLRSAEPAIVVAADLAPADMLTLKQALGFAIDTGGATSHSAILARGMNVPAVVGVGRASELIVDDDWLILDGDAGLVIVAPDELVLTEYRHRQAAGVLELAKLKRLVHVPTRTLDGQEIALHANIELPEEAEQALEAGAVGVGLFRSEFLFLNRKQLPDEEEQLDAYRMALQGMKGRPVTIRTLDIGADKALQGEQFSGSPNPALGLRAIRYCLAQPDMFLTQLRAMLRASPYGKLRILVPMLVHSHEIKQTLRLIAQAKAQLRDRKQAFDDTVAIGGMVEVPAAALSVGMFLKQLDFLSIGTNDLIQYTLAIDRADYEVAALYDPFHPAVLQLIAMTIRAARKAGKPVAVCGEMAGDWLAARLLLGMGLTEFSMQSSSLMRVKREVLLANVAEIAPRVARLLTLDDPDRVATALLRLREEGVAPLSARARLMNTERADPLS